MKNYNSNIPEIELKYKSGNVEKVQIKSSKEAADLFGKFYNEDTLELNETFIVLFLNRANKSIGWLKVSTGGITGTVVDIRLIFGAALKAAATGIIVSHNHPSGQLSPSQSDIDLTKKIKEAGKILDISLLDHIIYTPSGYYSFVDEGTI